MRMEIEVLVIGAGQAGLAAGYYLQLVVRTDAMTYIAKKVTNHYIPLQEYSERDILLIHQIMSFI
ncbi:hypothetical protein [Paenibacillus terrigena]|uniref:hypothetical protein n=1 Tax=Paenibacillus terrigena TaxID=369333 RepID=UPI0028D64A35|nr:hypothetical protein [Paenibacillus terrigena]